MESAALYDSLYAVGYHNQTEYHHAQELLRAVSFLCSTHSEPLSSLLDVGCSHGAAVQWAWRRGLTANGVDVSHIAVELAYKTRVLERNVGAAGQRRGSDPSPNCLGSDQQRCFLQASAAVLPFANNSFDVVISSDVLEHLRADDVAPAVREVSRVGRKVLLLKISNRHEGNSKELKKVRQQRLQGANLPARLHTTVRGPNFWIERFNRAGWALHHMLEARSKVLQGAHRQCCSYVLQPMAKDGAVEQQRLEIAKMSDAAWWAAANQCKHGRSRVC